MNNTVTLDQILNSVEEIKIKQDNNDKIIKSLILVLEHFQNVIEDNTNDTFGAMTKNKNLKEELMCSPNMSVKKILKWKKVIGITYKDLYNLNKEEKKNKVFSIMALNHKHLDSETKRLLILEVIDSIILNDDIIEFSSEEESEENIDDKKEKNDNMTEILLNQIKQASK